MPISERSIWPKAKPWRRQQTTCREGKASRNTTTVDTQLQESHLLTSVGKRLPFSLNRNPLKGGSCLFSFLGLHFLSFWPFGASCPFILAFWAFISFRFGILGLHFLSFWPFGPSFPFILTFWAFISFHFGLLCLHLLSFWPFGPSFPFILAFWVFISFYFLLAGAAA